MSYGPNLDEINGDNNWQINEQIVTLALLAPKATSTNFIKISTVQTRPSCPTSPSVFLSKMLKCLAVNTPTSVCVRR